MSNQKLYTECEERELSIDMKLARWRSFGHMLRLPLETPCQKAMQWYFEIPNNSKKYKGNQRITLPLVLHDDIVNTSKIHPLEVQKFKTTEDLEKWREIGADRKKWKEIVTLICSTV